MGASSVYNANLTTEISFFILRLLVVMVGHIDGEENFCFRVEKRVSRMSFQTALCRTVALSRTRGRNHTQARNYRLLIPD